MRRSTNAKTRDSPGTDSAPVSGRKRSTSATSSSRTTSRTTVTSRSSRPRPSAPRRSGSGCKELFVEERKKGVLDISQIPSSITAHAPGLHRPRERDHRRPADRRAAQAGDHAQRRLPHGRSVRSKTYGYEPDPHVVETFTKYRKTHNEGVFDAYTADIRRCRSSHVLTGLPDAYGRGRIIGDYRRVPLYGVTRLIEHKEEEKAPSTRAMSTEEIIRDREELSEQIRALKELQQMAASYGFDISGPARNAQRGRPVALLRLPGRREGAERRRDVAGTHLDVPRHLLPARSGRRHADRGSRPRRSSTTSSSSCASCASCARRSTTSSSPAIRPG